MFDIQLRLTVAGRPVAFGGFIEAVVAEIARQIRAEIQTLPQIRPVGVEPVWRPKAEEEKGQKRLAVGVDETARLLGLSPATIRQYVARGRIRAVRVGRRVLVPMEVLEKVMVEGVERGFR